jgi:hypothetical protein
MMTAQEILDSLESTLGFSAREKEQILLLLGICVWCGVRPVETPNAQNACTKCEDMLLSCL